ncbi:somatic embryogenesis protein kinase 3 [Artemisia annua]|uniref:Somatic embryogenesis protein kinase 3 n=1 Tax=Artemisia annua TaxID=35608 RepID=A0A2U1L1R5_ARTAN|nr:somatic embryogenesis protein kinase 3 [Artemisia annua]
MAAACIFAGFINVWYYDDPHNNTLMRMTLAWCRHRKTQDRFLDEEETQVYVVVKRFSRCELQVATDNFSVKNIYLTRWICGGCKKTKKDCCQGGELWFQMEAEMISMAAHPNLLLLGIRSSATLSSLWISWVLYQKA